MERGWHVPVQLSLERPYWLVLLAFVPVVLALGWPRLRTIGRWRRRVALPARALVFGLLIIALARPVTLTADDSLAVAFVMDESESMAGPTREAAAAWLERALDSAQPDDRVTVVRFGRRAALDGPESNGQLGTTPSGVSVDGTATNLDGALRLAGDLLPATGARRVVVLSDGWENVGSAHEAVRDLSDGTQLSFVAPGEGSDGAVPEVAVRVLEAPRFVRDGATFEAAATVDSTVDVDAKLRLWLDDRLAAEQPVRLTAGSNRIALAQRARSLGTRRLRVDVTAAGDARADNNAAESTTVVKPAGRVLLLQGHEGEAGPLAESLREGGLDVDVQAPSTVPPRTESLEGYDSIGLVNVAATQLTLDQQRTIQQYVESLGRGLFVAGGNTSYALGGYANTVLDEVLPLSPAPPPRREQGTVALFLVVDKSGSMDLYRSDVSKMALAREGASLAVESLRPEDTLGVLAFETRHSWVVPPSKITSPDDLRNAQAQIAGIRADGGTAIFPALEEAYKAAAQSDAKLKHILLLTDGQSFNADYAGLINRMRPFGITLSTVAIGSDSDTKLLIDLAQIGTGRYYFTERAQDIPKITTKETTIVTRSALVEGRILPRLVEPSPVMLGMTGGELPPLGGYVATSPRPRASMVLASDRGDPLLAHWQYGLGRVVAWASDVNGGWTPEWQSWPEASRFWQQAVRWTMPEPVQSAFQVGATVVGDQVTLRAQSVRPDGRFADLLDTRATVVAPDGQGREVRLPQTGPGTYELTTTVANPGTYEVRFTQGPGGRPDAPTVREETLGFTVLGSAEQRSIGTNRALLNRLAGRTGGRELAEPADSFARDVAPTGERRSPLWPSFAAAAVLLFPLDVAIRRLRFARR